MKPNISKELSQREWQLTKSENAVHKYPNSFYFHLPEKLSIGSLVDKFPEIKVPRDLKEAEALLILHLITQQTAIDISTGIYHLNAGFVVIDEHYLNSIGITAYKKYIKYFLECGIIEQSTHNLFRTRKRGIRFTEKYVEKNHQMYYNYPLFLDAYRIEEQASLKDVREYYPSFAKWWKTNKVQIDYPAAYDHITALLNFRLGKATNEYQRRVAFGEYNSALLVLDRILRKDYYIKSHNGYVISLFTLLPKELRKFIRFGGEELVSIGIGENQQIYIFDHEYFLADDITQVIRKHNPQIPIFVHYNFLTTTIKYRDEVEKIISESLELRFETRLEVFVKEWC